jgi:hypothetical protein
VHAQQQKGMLVDDFKGEKSSMGSQKLRLWCGDSKVKSPLAPPNGAE